MILSMMFFFDSLSRVAQVGRSFKAGCASESDSNGETSHSRLEKVHLGPPIMRRIVFALSLLVLVIPARAATYYVAANGSDSNTCATAASACLTFNSAYRKAKIGDTV